MLEEHFRERQRAIKYRKEYKGRCGFGTTSFEQGVFTFICDECEKSN